MQKVPLDKILIQPTVQYQWLKQHGEIEFNLPSHMISEFVALWALFEEYKNNHVAEFLATPNVAHFYLEQNDLLFALFTGAHYAHTQNSGFEIKVNHHKMTWHIGV